IFRLEERPALLDRGAAVRGDVELLDDRQLRGERTARLPERRPVACHLRREGGELRVRGDHPGIGHPRRTLHGGVVVGGEPERRARLLDRAEAEARLGQTVEAPVMGHLVFRPEACDDLQALDEAGYALLRVHAEGLVFLLAIAEANAEDEASLADD